MVRNRTIFTDPAAVEAWDAWFRWRTGGVLHDRTIEATWLRVVNAVAPVEASAALPWAARWRRGFSRWEWLPDESLLREAGTGLSSKPVGPMTATINLNAFVRRKPSGRAHAELDLQSIADTAAIALRFLDDALLALPVLHKHSLAVGLMGVADALEALGIDYDSPDALQAANDAGAALATGALRGAIDLARERGGRKPARRRLAFLLARGLPPSLAEDALHWGVRHESRTAIVPTPRLARLANNVSDALDPCSCARPMDTQGDRTPCPIPATATQLRLRSAIQPWIDKPIDYPAISAECPGSHASSSQSPLVPSAPRATFQKEPGELEGKFLPARRAGHRKITRRKSP